MRMSDLPPAPPRAPAPAPAPAPARIMRTRAPPHTPAYTPPRARGRPRIVTAETVDRALKLRAAGCGWTEIGLRLGLRSETCRRAVWEARCVRKAVVNSRDPQVTVGAVPVARSGGRAVGNSLTARSETCGEG